LKTIILPKKNEKDLVDVPKKALSDLEIFPVEHMDEVLKIAMLPPKKQAAKQKTASSSKKPPEEPKPSVQPGA
jgi:ATP-dependent Lon protease